MFKIITSFKILLIQQSDIYLFICILYSSYTLKGMDTLAGEAILSQNIFLPSEKRFTLKRKNLLPLRANSFLLE